MELEDGRISGFHDSEMPPWEDNEEDACKLGTYDRRAAGADRAEEGQELFSPFSFG